MARHNGGRGAPRGPPRGSHAPPQHATHAPYTAPPPPLPPRGVPPSRGFGMAPHRPHPHHPPLPPPPYLPSSSRPSSTSTAALERDVASFVHSLRASRSDPVAPPNALNVRDAIQAICSQFGTAAYESLCATAHPQLPTVLRALHTQHERVWSFVTCYRHARRLHTLYECHEAFLQHEGIQHMAELGIGNSFLHTDAVQSLYQSPSSIYRLTTMDVLSAFRQFEQVMGHDAFSTQSHHSRMPQRIDREQFKQFIAQQRRQPSAEAMGLYIDPDGFGPYIAMLRRVAKKEQREIHELQEEFNKGIADRVFELSKEKFSAENRKQALTELLQRTSDEREKENETTRVRLDASTSSVPTVRRVLAKKAATTLASLSLDILNRVTDVDVYLDNMLRWKSADERYTSRLASYAIADTDQKIRTQLTPFLLASQKSRHHARVKVVTWVLCGVLAKIHTLLQLDDKIPEPTPPKVEERKEDEEEEEEDEDEGEECDCCCVGEDSCRCRCECACHRDDSDEEEKPTVEAVKETMASASSAKRNTSGLHSDSLVAVVPVDEIKAALERYLTEQLTTNEVPVTTEQTIKLLAHAETHLRATFGASLGSFSLLDEVATTLETPEDREMETSALQQLLASLRQSHAQQNSSLSRVSSDELCAFVSDCVQTLPKTDDNFQTQIFQRVCVQFELDQTDTATRRWVNDLIADVAKGESAHRTEEGSIVHYAGVLTLSASAATTHELALLDDEITRDQVLSTKTTEALTALAQCPYLVDVGVWTHWRSRFAPFCGSLRMFLRSHEMIRCGDDHAAAITAAEFVWGTNDHVVKIRGSGAISASSLDTMDELSPEAVAVAVVSLSVQHRGATDDFPRALVVLHLQSILKRDGETETERANATATFVRETMLAVPRDFAAFVWGLLEEAARITDLEREVVETCQSRFERRQLQLLGHVLAKPQWEQTPQSSLPIQERILVKTLPCSTTPAAPRLHVETSSLPPVDAFSDQHSLSVLPPLPPLDASVCEAFITTLRREQFGIGLTIADASTRAVLHAQHRRLERALKRLSDELYSEKTHFVLELLQNADDNTYPVNTIPRGEFTLTEDGTIVFTNNEIGFSNANIHAICDVGASTKAQESSSATHKHSIGKKGIGFKSVFKVSDTPEVHSNGFHIQFHANEREGDHGLGYVLPYWISDPTRWRDAAGTTFVLPLNAHSVQRQREISVSLLAFEPSVLLFLQQIRELRLVNQVSGGRLQYTKHERVVRTTADAVVSLATLQAERVQNGDRIQSTQRWFILRRQLEIPSAFAQRGPHTEIAIAVPDVGDEREDEENQRAPLQQVFCYLPLRSYGFRFIVQGDFEVPSSREAISNGSDWNQWLIAQYPLLIPSLVELVTAQQLSLSSVLRVLPLDSDIQAPFRAIVLEISRAMRQSPCFPVVGESGDLATASDVLDVSEFAGDSAIEVLVNDPTMVAAALNKRILDLETARAMPALLKAQLRIERLRASHVLRLLASVASTQDPQVVLHLLHLLVKLLRFDRHRTLMLQELRRIQCFPVRRGANETWQSLLDVQKDSVLFLRSMQTASTKTTSRLFVDELSLLTDSFTSLVETRFPEMRRFLIDQLGIKELEDHDLALHHILPALAQMTANDEDRLAWAARVTFLAAHVASCGTACSLRAAIRQSMRVVTWSKRVLSCRDDQTLYILLPSDTKRLEAFSGWLHRHLANPEVGGDVDIVALDALPDVEEDVLRGLFVECCQLPQLLDPGNHTALGQTVQWIQSESDLHTKQRVSTELAKVMDAVWGGSIVVEDESAMWWQRGAWLEGSDGCFYHPRDLWVASPAVVALFAPSMVPTSKVSFASERLRAAWRFKTVPRVDDVLYVLKTLSQKDVGAMDLEVSHLVRLYTYLLEQSRGDEVPTSAAIVRKAFTALPLIYLPPSESPVLPARFAGVQSVVWSSGSSGIASVAIGLDAIYPKTLRPFFIGVCGVERKPTIEQLQQQLAALLTTSSNMSLRQWTTDVSPILQQIAKALGKHKLTSTQEKALKKVLMRLAWIPLASADADTKQFQLGSMKRAKDRGVVFPEGDAGREIVRLCTSLLASEATDVVVEFVGMDADLLSDLVPLLRLVGAISVCESLLSHPAAWCRWLATLGAEATVNESQGRRRSRKKYEKLLNKILVIWATAWGEKKENETPGAPLFPLEFTTELSTQSLFPSIRSEQLHRGVDLFLNDQHTLSQNQLQHSSLAFQSLFGWDRFTTTTSDAEETSNIQKLLLDAARMRSLAQHLHTEVVLLGPQEAFPDDTFTRSFHLALSVLQRIVFHQHATSYTTLDHTTLQSLLSHLRLQQVAGELQLLHRVATTDFTLRQSVACYLDTTSQSVVVATASDSLTLLFEVLREVCRQCVGEAIATSVANVLYLASMQPTRDALETWLTATQQVPPLDARAGTIRWVAEDVDAKVSDTVRSKRSKRDREANEADVEDGEVSDDDSEAVTKRARVPLPWEHDHQQSTRGWASSDPYHTPASVGYHPHHGAAAGSPHHPSPFASQPPTGLASLAFNNRSQQGPTTNGLSDDEKLAIGRWGEEYVYLQLQQRYADRADVSVEWVNAGEESGLPYDIVVKTGTSHDVEYVEVKSTKTMEKGVFEISLNELDQAAMHGSKYCIYRVFNAGNAALCRVVRMKNPVALVRQKKIQLVLLMQ